MTDKELIFTQERHLGLITLNRPQALNALTFSMILALQQQLTAWATDSSIHAVAIRAVEGKAFCAGGDVRWLYEAGRAQNSQQLEFFRQEYHLNQFIYDYSKPYIALMDGITMGGGVGISLHGSHPVASERFVFAMPETAIGFFPDIGASYLLARCPDQIGLYLGLTGNRIQAADAYEFGLVKQVIRSEDFSDVLHALIEADLSIDANKQVTDCLSEFAMPVLPLMSTETRELIAGCFNAKNIESIMSALGERNEIELVDNLNQKSPLSLKITLQQLRQAEKQTLSDCLKIDTILVKHFMQGHDFYEGVRALLIDKDKLPRWQPSTLTQVTKVMVDDYFKG